MPSLLEAIEVHARAPEEVCSNHDAPESVEVKTLLPTATAARNVPVLLDVIEVQGREPALERSVQEAPPSTEVQIRPLTTPTSVTVAAR